MIIKSLNETFQKLMLCVIFTITLSFERPDIRLSYWDLDRDHLFRKNFECNYFPGS